MSAFYSLRCRRDRVAKASCGGFVSPVLASFVAVAAMSGFTGSVAGAAGSDPEAMVAVFDGGGVSVEEYKKEFEKAAAKYAAHDMEQYRRELLIYIVTNKLLAREAKEQGYVDELGERDPVIIEKKEKAMVNQLRRSVILAGVAVTDEEVQALYDRHQRRRLTKCIAVGNKKDADEVMARLAAGEDFVEVAREVSLDLGSASWNAQLAWMKVGDAPGYVEELIDGLELGEIGGPIETAEGYYIFRVDSLETVTHDDFGVSLDRFRSTALKRKRTPIIIAFMDSVAQARGVRYHEDAMDVVIERFNREGWVEDEWPGRASAVPEHSAEELRMTICSFGDESYSVEEYLDYVDSGTMKRANPAFFLAGREEMERGLRSFVRDRLELYLAYEMEMDKVRSVRGLTRENAAKKGVVDMLVAACGGEESARTTDKERRAYYEENKSRYTEPGAIVVTMVTVTDMEVVDALYEDMRGGAPYSQVAQDYRWVLDKDRTGERLRLESKEDNYVVFEVARRMELGAASEPIPLPEGGYAVIRLLEREPARVMPYEEVKGEVTTDLNFEILTAAAETMEQFKQGLRDKYNVRVNEEVLQSVDL